MGTLLLAACHADPVTSALDDPSSGPDDQTGETDATDATGATAGPAASDSADTSTTSTPADETTSDEPPADASLSEIDCHGRDGIELAAAPGSDLAGLAIVIDGVPDYVLREGSRADAQGLFVVREAEDGAPGLAIDIACTGAEIVLARDGETLDAQTLPAFPGSFEGTTWCSGTTAEPFALCTPTLGAPNLPYVDPGELLFDRREPVVIELTVDAAGLAALALDPREYVAGSFSVTSSEGTTAPIEIGVALKGSVGGSFVDLEGKAAFKLKLDFVDDDTRFLGLRGLKLNNMLEDPSQLREAVAYAALGELGIPAPRSGYAEVLLNGESYGLHATVERVDDVWLSRTFPSTLHLYEGTSELDITPGREAEFSVDEGDPLDTSDLTALMAVSVLPDDEYLAGLEAHTRLDPLLQAWAASMLLGHNDGYATAQNNYSLHSDALGVFDLVPSGFDQSQRFLIDLHGGSAPIEQRGILFVRCIELPACLERYDEALDAIGQALAGFDAQAEIDDIAAAIEPWVEQDPRRAETLDEVHAAQDETRTYWLDLASTLP
jgi:hypothetical protein